MRLFLYRKILGRVYSPEGEPLNAILLTWRDLQHQIPGGAELMGEIIGGEYRPFEEPDIVRHGKVVYYGGPAYVPPSLLEQTVELTLDGQKKEYEDKLRDFVYDDDHGAKWRVYFISFWEEEAVKQAYAAGFRVKEQERHSSYPWSKLLKHQQRLEKKPNLLQRMVGAG